jgi:uncharacterized SAM-binding protein YcdF (DUF218 family)
MTFYVFVRSLFAPPGLQLLLLLLGLWCLHRRRLVLGRSLVAFALLTLYLMATPWGASLLAAGLERDPPLDVARRESWQGAGAIVVLGGGRETAPEFGGQDIPSYWTASRLRYGALLYRETGLPLLVSGGRVLDEAESEAAVMTRSLTRDHIVNVRWQEDRSRTTWENAQFSRALLAAESVDRILLVTQGLHMRRARMAFEHAGFEVVPAPVDTGSSLRSRSWVLRVVPNPVSFLKSSQALHEYAGLVAYRLRMLGQ